MKIHISLVGGQPIPIYLGIQAETPIDRVFLIYSQQTKAEAQRIQSICTEIHCELVECHPTQLEEIQTTAQELLTRTQDCEVSINLSGGTKAWSLIFFETFRPALNVKFLLVDQNNVIHNLLTHESRVISITKELRLALHGALLEPVTPFSRFTQQDIEVAKQLQRIRKYNLSDFGKLTEKSDSIENSGNFSLPNDSSISWNKEKGRVHLMLRAYNGKYFKSQTLVSPHCLDIVFNNAWFELLTAYELSKNEMVKEIWMNCFFKSTQKRTKNEIDIILDMGTKLFFVECKTKVFNTTDIDKFHSAIKNFSGTSSKGIFVTLDEHKGNYDKVYQQAMEKCKDNNILTFNFSEYSDETRTLELNRIINEDLTTSNIR